MAPRRNASPQHRVATITAVRIMVRLENGIGEIEARSQSGQMMASSPIGRAKKAPYPGKRRKSHAESGAAANPAASETMYQRAMSSIQFIDGVPGLLNGNNAGGTDRTPRECYRVTAHQSGIRDPRCGT